jgi:hypothetical protein
MQNLVFFVHDRVYECVIMYEYKLVMLLLEICSAFEHNCVNHK